MLVVEDHARTRAELKRILEHYPRFEVKTAEGVVDALKVLDENAVDAVVADLKLSEDRLAADGGHLLDAVARWHGGIHCRILMTANPLGASMARSGGYLFFDKRRNIRELVAMIRQSVPRAS